MLDPTRARRRAPPPLTYSGMIAVRTANTQAPSDHGAHRALAPAARQKRTGGGQRGGHQWGQGTAARDA